MTRIRRSIRSTRWSWLSIGIFKPQGGYYGWDDLRKKAEQLANKDDRHYALFKHSLEKGVLSSDELLYGLVLMGRAVLEDPKCKFDTMFRGHQ